MISRSIGSSSILRSSVRARRKSSGRLPDFVPSLQHAGKRLMHICEEAIEATLGDHDIIEEGIGIVHGDRRITTLTVTL